MLQATSNIQLKRIFKLKLIFKMIAMRSLMKILNEIFNKTLIIYMSKKDNTMEDNASHQNKT